MKTAIVNLGIIVTGDWRKPFADGDTILMNAAVRAAISDGVPRFVGRSRNTPAPMKRIRVAHSRIVQDFAPSAH
jgi:hypothetical protein